MIQYATLQPYVRACKPHIVGAYSFLAFIRLLCCANPTHWDDPAPLICFVIPLLYHSFPFFPCSVIPKQSLAFL